MKKIVIVFSLYIFLTTSLFAQVIRNPLRNPGDGDEGDMLPGSVVKLIGDNTIVACNEGEKPSGVIILTQPMRNQSDQYQITTSGVANFARYAGDIDAGDPLVPADDGAVQSIYRASSRDYIIGTAIESGSAGDRKKILVNLEKATESTGSEWFHNEKADYIRPVFANFPEIFGDNTEISIDGVSPQIHLKANGENNNASLYITSDTDYNGTSWAIDGSKALIKAHNADNGEYGSAIAGYSDLNSNFNAAIIGQGSRDNDKGDIYTALATSLPKFNGSLESGQYAAQMVGDFYNQEVEAAFQDVDVGDSWADIQTVEINTHGSGPDSSIVLINASATITTDCTMWSGFPNDQWGFAYIRIIRDGQHLCGSANAVVGQYTYVYPIGSKFFGGAASLSITSFDEPVSGKHTYTLQYENSALDIVDYKPFGLSVVEIKR